tara:strand:+ start:1072 stop:2016 length:945 start_codon:yes stop_codon:yes gene_type:complete
MKLDKLDKRILVALRKNSKATLRELSKEVGNSKENIHYRIKKYEKNKILTYIPSINLSKIGYNYFLIRLRANPSSEVVKKELDSITKNKDILWVSFEKILKSEDFNITLLMIGKNFSDVEDYVQSLRIKKHISSANTRLMRVISKSYTSFIEEKDKEITYFKAGEHRYSQNFDDTDSKIITELINNSRITNIDFGKKVRLNHVTIKTRITKLLNEKLIDKFTVAIKYNKLPGKVVRMTLRKGGSMFTKKMINLLAKPSEEVMILAPYFSQERIIFLRTKNDEKLMTTISEINKIKDITITSVSENTEILKNKIF